jgi:hypothetical protein
MAQATERIGETFGIGLLHPGRAEGAVPRFVSRPTPNGVAVEALPVSTLVVGLAEIGDKTQILSLMLAARFQRPVPIIFGILFATLANHRRSRRHVLRQLAQRPVDPLDPRNFLPQRRRVGAVSGQIRGRRKRDEPAGGISPTA